MDEGLLAPMRVAGPGRACVFRIEKGGKPYLGTAGVSSTKADVYPIR